MDRGSARPRDRRFWIGIVAGLVVGALVVLGIGPPALFLPRVTTCQLGTQMGTYTIWTPNLLANIPDGGNVTVSQNEWNLTMSSGSLTTNSLRPFSPPSAVRYGLVLGSMTGISVSYGDFNWTFYRTENVSAVGTASGPCTQPYIATISIPGGACGATATVPIPDNASDIIQPRVWNGTGPINGTETYPGCPQATPGTYVWFDSSYHSDGSGTSAPVSWNLCGLSGFHQLVLRDVASVPIVVTVPYGGHDISASGYLSWDSAPGARPYLGPTAVYLAPGGWNWTMAPVGPAATPIDPNVDVPSLVAFVRSAC